MEEKPLTIVASGYFDPIHKGHIECFKLIKEKYPNCVLIAIVNNDKQATLKKGKPFMTEEDRLYITNSIKHVDKVVLSLDEDASICKSLEHIKPHIFAKGGDRHEGNIPEYEICQKLGIKIESGFGAKIRSSSELVKNKNLNTK